MRTRTMALCLIGTWLTAPALNLAADMGTAFTYQGRLVKSGAPVTNTCNFTFGLWDDPLAGIEKGASPVGPLAVPVANGLFTVGLNFGPEGINGTARWLEITVQCPGDPLTTLTPRQELKPAPHALALPGFYTQQSAPSPNLIGGYHGNEVTAGVIGATISGGGRPDDGFAPPDNNRVTTDYGTIGGGQGNQAGGAAGAMFGSPYATVGGGYLNTASGFMSTVGGGTSNTASGDRTTVGGGQSNMASGSSSTVGGGQQNIAGSVCLGGVKDGQSCTEPADCTTPGVCTAKEFATVGGGSDNTASGGASTVPGGVFNQAGGNFSFAAGHQAKVRNATQSLDADGDQGTFVWADSSAGPFISTGPYQFLIRAISGVGINTNAPAEALDVSGNIHASGTIASGSSITIDGTSGSESISSSASLDFRTAAGRSLRIEPGFGTPNIIGGYAGNSVTPGVVGATIGGGGSFNFPTTSPNTVTDNFGTVDGGQWNRAGDDMGAVDDAAYATVGGGDFNIAGGYRSVVAGGSLNTASGYAATVPGGENNVALGQFSFAAGRQAKANHDGTFVWADSPAAAFVSDAPNRFLVRASGGTTIYSNSALTAGVTLASGGGAWAAVSDRNLKENFAVVDARGLLERLISIPITTWNYKSQDDSIRHIGPMGQDFYAAFGIGEQETRITTIDADGVALAAIQGLHQIVREKDCEVEQLREQKDKEIAELQNRLSILEGMMNTLTAQMRTEGGSR